jgi:selenide,water dikinase
MVGFDTADDAAIYRLTDDLAVVQTVDLFPPVVDDPYHYGAIAAANSLSDVYAMGARPLTALNIICYPGGSLSTEVLTRILKGSADKIGEAGVSLVGGHTLEDPEPKYGLCVMGVVHPDHIVTNSRARPGDRLVLTKPLGIGILTTALKAGLLGEDTIGKVVAVMSRLNRVAAEAMTAVGAHACTDITGFGLLGHLYEMVRASGVGALVRLSQVPVLAEAWPLVEERIVPGGSYANMEYLKEDIQWGEGVSREAQIVLCDAQTSGGLLISVAADRLDSLQAALRQGGTDEAAVIGEITSQPKGKILVEA